MAIGAKVFSTSAKLAALSPFLAGPLFDSLPPFKTFLVPYLERYLYFAALLFSWNAFLYFITRFYLPHLAAVKGPAPSPIQPAGSFLKRSEVLKFLTLLLLAALVILSLDFFQRIFPQSVFHLALFTCAAVAVKKALQVRHKIILSTIAEWLYLSSVAYLSFIMTSLSWRWQPIMISIGLGSITATRPLARILSNPPKEAAGASAKKGEAKEHKWIYRCHSLFTALAPTMLGCLCYLGQLPRSYLAAFLILALFYRLPDLSQKTRQVENLAQLFLYRTDLAVSLYVVILIIIAIF